MEGAAQFGEGQRRRLVRALRLLSSNHVGEVAAAAAAVQRILKAAGLDWEQIIACVGETKPPRPAKSTRERKARQPHPPRPPRPPQPQPPPVEPHEVVPLASELLRWPEFLRERDIEFLNSLLSWRTRLTDRQAAWLAGLAERVRRMREPGF